MFLREKDKKKQILTTREIIMKTHTVQQTKQELRQKLKKTLKFELQGSHQKLTIR